MSKISASHIALSGMIALLASSCGNYVGKKNYISTSAAQTQTDSQLAGSIDYTLFTQSGTTVYGNYTCSNAPNVDPTSVTTGSNAGYYTACTDSTSVYNIMIKGQTEGDSSFCVFPIQYVDSTHVYWKPDLTTGEPYSICASTTSSSGVDFTFAGISFNAVIIVDQSSQQSMQSCLASANSGACPVYSYGRFR